MTQKTILSLIESPTHPKLSNFFKHLGFREIQVESSRKAINVLKKDQVDFIVAEFFYGYGNNYAGVNVSNLDVLLSSLPRYSPQTKTIVFVMKDEVQYVNKLHQLYPLHGVFLHSAPKSAIEEVLKGSS